jgi:hypothetical protein
MRNIFVNCLILKQFNLQVGLQWLKESPNCDWEGYEATSLTGRIALTNMDKCSILQKAVISQKANATSLIVINNGSFPSINDVNLSLEIGIFIMEKGLLDNVQVSGSHLYLILKSTIYLID